MVRYADLAEGMKAVLAVTRLSCRWAVANHLGAAQSIWGKSVIDGFSASCIVPGAIERQVRRSAGTDQQ